MSGVAAAGRTVDLGGPVHLVDFGGTGRPPLVLVHGLGGSHLNWDLLAPRLTDRARVLAVDLPGFGLSAPTRHPATVRRNVRLLARFVEDVADPPVVLVGNSMGGLVSLLVAARRPELVAGLALLDPALPAPARVLGSPTTAMTLALHALPGVGEALRRSRRHRIGARATVEETLHRCGVDPAALPPELLARSVALVEHNDDVRGADRAFLSASRSLAWALARSRTLDTAARTVRAPVLLLHGDRDGLVPVTAARRTAARHPAWHYAELSGVGHLPQLQAPGDVATHLAAWLDRFLQPPTPAREEEPP